MQRFLLEDVEFGNFYRMSFNVGIVDERVRFYMIKVALNIDPVVGNTVLHEYYKKCEDLVEKYNQGAPVGLQGMFQTTELTWQVLFTQITIWPNMKKAMVFAVPIATLALFVTTFNII